MKKETRKALENIAAEMIAGGMQYQGATLEEIKEQAAQLNDNELILYILDFVPDNLETRLNVFEEMRNDLTAVAEHENDLSILEECATVDNDILTIYQETYLN